MRMINQVGRANSIVFPCGVGLTVLLYQLCHLTAVHADEAFPTTAEIKASIQKSIPLLEKGARGSLQQRKQCFNCHNQGLPVIAMTAAKSRGIAVDSELYTELVQFTAEFLNRNRQRYRDGQGQGGQIDTAGYALWTLEKGGWTPNETTAAVAEYLLIHQNQLDHYESEANRPPGEQSDFTSTYVALRGLKVFGTVEQRELIEARIERIREWLLKTDPLDNEDRVFRLRTAQLLSLPDDVVRQASNLLKNTQNSDGSWSQTAEMAGDAYATGTALVGLHEAGGLATDDPIYRSGMAYLISQQGEDGSWHVVSHAKPFQSYFESGYPHGKDQFISSAAASWCTIALALALPDTATVSDSPVFPAR